MLAGLPGVMVQFCDPQIALTSPFQVDLFLSYGHNECMWYTDKNSVKTLAHIKNISEKFKKANNKIFVANI